MQFSRNFNVARVKLHMRHKRECLTSLPPTPQLSVSFSMAENTEITHCPKATVALTGHTSSTWGTHSGEATHGAEVLTSWEPPVPSGNDLFRPPCGASSDHTLTGTAYVSIAQTLCKPNPRIGLLKLELGSHRTPWSVLLSHVTRSVQSPVISFCWLAFHYFTLNEMMERVAKPHLSWLPETRLVSSRENQPLFQLHSLPCSSGTCVETVIKSLNTMFPGVIFIDFHITNAQSTVIIKELWEDSCKRRNTKVQ